MYHTLKHLKPLAIIVIFKRDDKQLMMSYIVNSFSLGVCIHKLAHAIYRDLF